MARLNTEAAGVDTPRPVDQLPQATPSEMVQPVELVPVVTGKPPEGVDTPPPQAPEVQEALVVRTRGKLSRRRAGRSFGAEPVTIPLSEITDEDRAALEADPMLAVAITTL